MKNFILLILLFTFINVSAQYSPTSPLDLFDDYGKQKTLNEKISDFKAFWKDKEQNKKSTGFKVFKRWEYHWQNQVDHNGFIISPKTTWDAVTEKQAKKKYFRTAAVAPVSNWQNLNLYNSVVPSTRARGRVNTVLVDPNNANTIYFGTPAGGLWKSTNTGSTWTPMTDELPQIGVSGIAVQPGNSNVIYISTGDADANDTYSIGVLKSIDGGLTWNTTGLTYTSTGKRTGEILINPNNINMLLVNTSDGVYRSVDAGVTWALAIAGNFSQGSIRFKPGDYETIYATTLDKFYKSSNAGATFTVTNLPVGFRSGRLLLEVSAADPAIVYLLGSTNTNTYLGISKSTNSGTSFSKVIQTVPYDPFDGGTQAWYDLAFTVSPTNSDELYIGLLNVWKSTDGGKTGTKLNDWSAWTNKFTHADIHFLRYFGSKLFCGSDGGIYVSQDNGGSFSDITGTAQISQIYKLSVSKQTSSKITGGLQDNGGFNYNNGIWKSYHGGDGMDNAIDPTNSNLRYGALYYAQSLFVSSDGGQTLSNVISAPANEGVAGTADTGGNWVTPITMNANGELHGGFSRLHKIVNGAWVQQSTGFVGSGDIEVVSFAPSDVNIVFVANGTQLYKSIDKGLNFNLVYTSAANITSVCVNYSDPNIVYLTSTAEAFKSINGGTTFGFFSTGLPNITKNVVVHQGRNINNPLYLGTTIGIYYRDDTMSQWEPFDTNLPNTSVTDLEINLEDNKITAATYGRGFWQTNIPVVTPNIDVSLVDILTPVSTNVGCENSVSPSISVKNSGLNTVNNVNVSYSINSTPYTYNWIGIISPSEVKTFNLPSTILSKGAYNLSINSSTTNDAFPDNNLGNKKFYLNDAALVNVTNGFENPSDELLKFDEGSVSSLWVRGTRTGTNISSGSNKVFTTSVSGNYPDKTKSYLVSGCYDLRYLAGATLSLKMAFDLELNWDVVYVEYSTNSGNTWNVLGVQGTGWYNSNRTNATSGAADDCQNCPGAQWTGLSNTLTTYTQSLSAINNQSNVIFRIVFHSDDAINNEGVIIDDFLVSGTLGVDYFENNRIVVSPNPSNGLFNININNYTGKLNIQVTDLNGRLVYDAKNTDFNTEKSIDLSAFQSGIYILKINNEDMNFSKKLIKN